MSSIVTEQGILHYESIGRGQPIILLHGWINSWNVWRDQMIALAGTGRYRVYALDFWGFGDSSKRLYKSQKATFEIESYVEMVHQFMDSLGILQAPIFGHSMGGTVALQMAISYPQRVKKVAVVGAPVVGTSLNPVLQLAGYGTIAKLVWRYPIMLHSIMRVLLAKDSKKVRGMIFHDVQRTTIESFFRSIGDLRETDMRQDLPNLALPMLAIYGKKDNIVSPTNATVLRNNVHNVQIALLEQSRHFPMTDEPTKFLELIHTFLADDVELARPSLNGSSYNLH